MRRTVVLISVCVLALGAPAAHVYGSTPAHPARHEDSGRIVFAADATGSYQLYTVDPGGRDLRQITHVIGDAVNPDWSPDGRHIVFEFDTPTNARIAVVDSDGSNLRLIKRSVPPDGQEGQPAFQPDGEHIVFERLGGVGDDAIFSERLDGTQVRRITPLTPTDETDPNVSPNGRSISFVRIDVPEVSQALFTADLDGGNEHQVTPFSFDVGIKQDWSPDGRRLVFTRTADNPQPGDSANVATIGANGKGLTMLTDYRGGDVNAYAGSYSPDGKWVVYRLVDHQAPSLVKIRPDGTHKTTILAVPGLFPRFIDWGPRPSEDPDED